MLDEIGDLPHPLQAKLLRFLQERKIERIGGRQEIAVDVRVVCATHQDLRG
jgi:two-component system NtrC family response regulator